MALRSLVQRNVDLAFNLIGDLATEVTLVPTTAGTYTFGTDQGIAGASTLASVTVSGVIQTVARNESNGERSNGTQLLFPAHRLPATFNSYTSVTLAGDDIPWDVLSWSSDGHLTTADIRRTVV